MTRQGLAESGPGSQACGGALTREGPGRWAGSCHSTAPRGHSADLNGPQEDCLIERLERTPNETKTKAQEVLGFGGSSERQAHVSADSPKEGVQAAMSPGRTRRLPRGHSTRGSSVPPACRPAT